MQVQRRPPFDRWPTQHRDEHYGYAWYCGRGLIVSHITRPHGTAAAAESYHDFEDRILRDHEAECTSAGGLFVIHDWRIMATYDSEARRIWQHRMRMKRKGYLRGSIVCVASAGALLRMAVQAANLVATLVHAAKVELSDDLDAALRAHGVASGPTGS